MRALRLAGVVLGAGVVVYLVQALGAARIGFYLGRLGPGMIGVLIVYLIVNIGYSLPLRILLEPVRVSLGAALAGRLAAVAVNAATPLLGLGGEPVRLLWLAPEERQPGVAALIVDRGAFLTASAFFLGLGTVVAVHLLPLPSVMRWGLVLIAGVAAVLALLLYQQQRRGVVAGWLVRLMGFFSRGTARRLEEGARDVDRRVRSLHLESSGRFTAACALHFGGRCLSVGEVLLAAHLLGIRAGFLAALVLTAIPLAVDLVLSFVPSQLGFQEGAIALVARALGFDAAAGVAIAIVQRMRQVVFVSLGFALLSLHRQAQRSRNHAPDSRR